MEKNALLLVKNGAKKCIQKGAKYDQKMVQKKGSGHGLTMVLNWVKMCFGQMCFSKIVRKNLEKYFAKLGKC